MAVDRAHQRSTDKQRRAATAAATESSETTDTARAMVLARWGGLGGHRYQVRPAGSHPPPRVCGLGISVPQGSQGSSLG